MALLLLCLISGTHAQNVQTKSIDANGIHTIEIDGNDIFNTSLKSSSTNSITIESVLDGSYQNEYQIISSQVKGILRLKLKKMDYAEIPDDKRNAHKLVAANLSLVIPENLKIKVLSDIGSLDILGQFQSVKAQLSQGYFKMNGSAGSLMVTTVDGDIHITTQSADVTAISTNGMVEVADFKDSKNQLKLQSINGNITVTQKQQ